MNTLKTLYLKEYINQTRDNLVKIDEDISITPMTYDQKLSLFEDLIKKSVMFGIQKGTFIERQRESTIRKALQKKLDRTTDELIFSINFRNTKYKDQPKVKYAKRKYRMRRKGGGWQLEIPFPI